MMDPKWRLPLSMRIFLAACLIVPGLTFLTYGQSNSQHQRVPVTEDWSTRHVIFSNPGTFNQATKTHPFLNWYKVQSDPRYQFSQIRRNAVRSRGTGGTNSSSSLVKGVKLDLATSSTSVKSLIVTSSKPKGDWTNYLGGTNNAGINAEMYGAKYTFDINAPPDCTHDFVVVPINAPPADMATATGTVVIAADPSSIDTVTIGSTVYDWQSSSGSCAGGEKCVFHDGTPSDDATNLASAIAGSCFNGACGADPDVTAIPAGTTVNLTAISTGSAGNVALATNDSGAISLSGSSLTGGADGQASIIAFNNLYTGGPVAASQVGSVSSNGTVSGSTVAINSVALTASDPTPETATITVGATIPAGASSVTVGGITYTFRNTATVNTPGVHACNVRSHAASGDTTSTVAASLLGALNSGGTGTTWACGASPGNSLVSASGSNPINLVAAAPGSTGFAFSSSGTTNFPVFSSTPGTDGTTSGLNFAYWSGAAPVSAVQLASNITSAINTNTVAMGVSATLNGTVITVTANTGGASGNVALSAGLPGFAWGGSSLVGGMGTGPCTGPPQVMWAYNASTANTPSPMLGSPILSIDGTKVAFVESPSGGAILHVLAWKAGDGGSNLSATPVAPSTTFSPTNNPGAWMTCVRAATGSCMFNLRLGTHSNTNSPPFYNYGTDTLYVGDNNGTLWKVTGVFNGTPAIAPFPWGTGVVVNSGTKNTLTGPIYDFGTGNILVADNSGQLSLVDDTTGALIATITGLGDIQDPPLIDPVTGRVFVFSGGNGTSAIVAEADTTSLSSGVPELMNIGHNSPGTPILVGTFDNNYFNDVSTGNLYVCGKQASHAAPALYSIGFGPSGDMTSITGGPLNLTTDNSAQECSPLAEIFNPNEGSGVDWMFVGVPAKCAFGGDATGCVMSFDITNGFPTTAFATATETGGTSGIIEDNVSVAGQTSSIYFTTLASPGAGGCNNEPSSDSTTCLVKLTQAGLQ